MDGGPKMAALIKTALAQCPSSKIVVSGYSQGAMVVHNALGKASSQVSGAVLFGDPLISQSVGSLPAAKVKEFCASADTVCLKPTGDVTGSHLSYGSVADAAASVVLKFAGLS
jgi:cutinase